MRLFSDDLHHDGLAHLGGNHPADFRAAAACLFFSCLCHLLLPLFGGRGLLFRRRLCRLALGRRRLFLCALAGSLLLGRLGRGRTTSSFCRRMALYHDAQLLLPGHGVNAGHVLAQSADLVQALRLSHLELELQTKELVIELLLLVQQFGVSQISKFFDIHVFYLLFSKRLLFLALGSWPLANTAYRTTQANY